MATINKLAEVCDMNPIRFVENDHPYAGYQTLYTDWWDNHIESPNVRTNFRQPWNFYDYIGVQIRLGGLYRLQQTEARLEVLDCSGKVLGELAPSYFGVLAGSTKTYNNTPFTMGTVNWKVTVGQFMNSREGIYYLRLKLPYVFNSQTSYDYWTSEPLHFKDSHAGTRIFEYLSYTNKLGVDYTSMFFHLRVPGQVEMEAPKFTGAYYDDQQMNPRQQNAVPYRCYALRMGIQGGLPMWMYDKVNRAFSNDYVLCDKVRYVRDNNAEIEIGNKVPRWMRYPATLKLREYDAESKTISISSAPLVLFPAYSGTNYCLYNGTMTNTGASYAVNYFNGIAVRSVAEEDNMLAILNNMAVPSNGLRGSYKRDGANIIYVNGEGESFDTSNAVILDKAFTLVYKKHSSTKIDPAIWLYADRVAVMPRSHTEVYIGGSGTVGNYQWFKPTYDFGTDAYAYIEVYHDDGIKKMTLGVNSVPNGALLEDIYVGTIPDLIEDLDIVFPYLPNGFDFSAWPATMKKIFIRYGGPFFTSISSFNKNWTLLSQVVLDNNWFSSSMVDSIFNQHYNGNAYTPPTGGVFKINSQQPAAPPTGASSVARTDLSGTHGWTIITD